jgi:hypothetical protein
MNPSPKPIRAPRLSIPILALPLYAMVLYGNTIGNGFVFDDIHQILYNPWIKDFSHLREIFDTGLGLRRPGLKLLQAPDAYFICVIFSFGPQAWVFHRANVILHGVATLLVSHCIVSSPIGR